MTVHLTAHLHHEIVAAVFDMAGDRCVSIDTVVGDAIEDALVLLNAETLGYSIRIVYPGDPEYPVD